MAASTATYSRFRPHRWALGGVILINLMVEAALQGADRGVWGGTLWRGIAYQYGGFWTGLLRDWAPNYSLQPELMFLTYSLLHAGTIHLLGNMLSLAILGDLVLARVGKCGFLRLYGLASIGAALGFGVLSRSHAPMIGASGAIFGLIGALVLWDEQDRRTKLGGLDRVLAAVRHQRAAHEDERRQAVEQA